MLKKLLSTIAPVLGGLIGGPMGSAATKAIAGVLLPDDSNASSDELELALKGATPVQISEIKRLDAEYKLELARLEFDDRKNARQREVDTRDTTPRNITYILTLGFFITMLISYWHPSSSDLMKFLTDSLCDVWIMAMGYLFGTARIKK